MTLLEIKISNEFKTITLTYPDDIDICDDDILRDVLGIVQTMDGMTYKSKSKPVAKPVQKQEAKPVLKPKAKPVNTKLIGDIYRYDL